MLSGDGNENGKKNARIDPNWQKSNFVRAAHLFCTFLCLRFVRLQRGTSRNFLVTRFMEEMSLSLIFTPVAAAILSSSFSRSASLGVALLSLFFCLSLSLYSKFVDMTFNLSLILKTTRIQKNFPLSVFLFIDSLVVSASQDVGGRTLSRQNKLTFNFGLHELLCTDGRAYTTS